MPQPIDDVCIGAAFTVTLSGADAAINSLTCDGSLSVSSMLTIAATSTINSLTLSGTLGGNGGVTIASLMNWTAGTVAGSTPLVIAPAARLNMLGGGGYVLTGRTVNNAGLTVLSGAGLFMQSSATFNNQPGATFDIQGDLGILARDGTTLTFNNAGAFRKSAGTGTSNVESGARFNNTSPGSVAVQTGTLNLPGGSSSGTFSTAAGTTLSLTNQTISGDITGSGNVSLAAGTTTLNGSHVSGATLTIAQGGTVNFNSGASISGITGALTINGMANFSTGTTVTLPSPTSLSDTLTGTDALVVNGIFNWNSGTISGSVATLEFRIAPAARVNMLGGSLSTRTLNNDGVMVLGGQHLALGGNATFNNRSGATFDLQTDFGILARDGTTLTFNNAGAFRKSAGTGTSNVESGARFNNTSPGSVAVQTGTLNLPGGTSSGTFSTAAGTTLSLTNQTISGDITGSGNVSLAAGTTTLNGSHVSGATLTIAQGGTVNFNSGASISGITGALTINGMANFSTGTTVTLPSPTSLSDTLTGTDALVVNGIFNCNGGTIAGGGGALSVAVGGRLNMIGSCLLTMRTVNNAGLTVLSGSYLFMQSSAIFNNQLGATFDIQNDATIRRDDGSNTMFNNTGIFQKSSFGGTSVVQAARFNNTGSVVVLTGTLALLDGTYNGSYSIAKTSTLDLRGLASIAGTFTGGGNLALSGAATFNGTNDFRGLDGSMVISGTGSFASGGLVTLPTLVTLSGILTTVTGADAAIVPGVLNWTGGTIGGAGALTIASGASLNMATGSHTLTSTLNNAGLVWLYAAGTMSMGGGAVLNNQAGAVFDIQNDQGILATGGTPAINNLGSLSKSAGSSTSVIGIPTTNSGVISSRAGVLSFTSTFSQLSGALVLDGGSLRWSSPLNIQGGTLRGSGVVNGDVVNTGGSVAPGAAPRAGALRIAGNYTQQSSGALNLKVGGVSPSMFDLFEATGSATLAGNLSLKVINGFRPACGSTYQVFNYGSRIGTFLSTTGTDLGGSLAFRPNYNVTNLVLEVIPVGPIAVVVSPSSATLQLGATQQFASTVTGTCNTAVIWSVQEGNSGGTVTTTGLYTAPQTPGTYHVVATSVADPGTSAAATVSVTASPALASKDKFQDDAGTTWKDGTGRSDDSASNPSPALASSCPNEPSVLATGQSDSWRMAADNSFVYWTSQTASDGAVLRVPICGGDVRVLASKQHDAYGIALDETTLYLTRYTALGDNVLAMARDGTRVRVLASDQQYPQDIAIDSGKVYWVNKGGGGVGVVASLVGEPVELASSFNQPEMLVTDGVNAYFATPLSGEIVLAPLDGGEPVVLASNQDGPAGIAVDSGNVYWVSQGAGTVSSVPIGGGSAVELARNQGSPMALALSNGELFWTNLDDDTIVCLPTLGGKPKVKVTAAGQPRTLVVNGVSIIWITSDGVIRKAAR